MTSNETLLLRSSLREGKSNNNNNNYREQFLVYYLLRNVKNGYDLSIPKERLQAIFSALRKRFGKVEKYKEYTKYIHWNMELTVLPNGSSFCHQVKMTSLDNNSSHDFLGFCKTKEKLSNDYFPPQYRYDAVIDVVDVIFSFRSCQIILRMCSEESDNLTASAESVTQLAEVQQSKTSWAEVLVKKKINDNDEDIYEILQFLQSVIRLPSNVFRKINK